MRPTLSDVSPGQKPSASWLNQLKEIACHEHTGAASSSEGSTVLKPTFAPELELYQLTNNPTLDDDAREYKAQAKPCTLRYCEVDVDGHVTGTGTVPDDKERYYFEEDATEETIWFPSGKRDSDKEPATPPSSKTGDRVWVAIACMNKIAIECIAGVPILWGKIQTSPVSNQSGATHLTVSVKSCDNDGDELGDQTAFDVKTPLDAKRRTALAYGDVVGYFTDADGEKIIVTDCWNHYIKVISSEAVDATCGFSIDDEGHIISWRDYNYVLHTRATYVPP